MLLTVPVVDLIILCNGFIFNKFVIRNVAYTGLWLSAILPCVIPVPLGYIFKYLEAMGDFWTLHLPQHTVVSLQTKMLKQYLMLNLDYWLIDELNLKETLKTTDCLTECRCFKVLFLILAGYIYIFFVCGDVNAALGWKEWNSPSSCVALVKFLLSGVGKQ